MTVSSGPGSPQSNESVARVQSDPGALPRLIKGQRRCRHCRRFGAWVGDPDSWCLWCRSESDRAAARVRAVAQRLAQLQEEAQ
jgi:hypothetical protein